MRGEARLPDGTWLVSASRDQTIAAWDLRGVEEPNVGGRFVLRGEEPELFVDEVTPGTALWEAGLTHKRRRQRRDKVAAQMLLQAYLDAGCPAETAPAPLEDPPA